MGRFWSGTLPFRAEPMYAEVDPGLFVHVATPNRSLGVNARRWVLGTIALNTMGIATFVAWRDLLIHRCLLLGDPRRTSVNPRNPRATSPVARKPAHAAAGGSDPRARR